MFLCRHRLYIHKGWHGTAMVIAHIIKINTMLRWPMGLVRQNQMVPLGVIVKQQTLHHTFPNSIREGTCRMSSKYWGDLVLCCVGKKKDDATTLGAVIKWLVLLTKAASSGYVIVSPRSSCWTLRRSAGVQLVWICRPYGQKSFVLFYT